MALSNCLDCARKHLLFVVHYSGFQVANSMFDNLLSQFSTVV